MHFTLSDLSTALRGHARTTPILVRMPDGSVCQVERIEPTRVTMDEAPADAFSQGVQAVVLVPGRRLRER